jgi:hypothetical protein
MLGHTNSKLVKNGQKPQNTSTKNTDIMDTPNGHVMFFFSNFHYILKRVGLSYLQAGLISPLTSAVTIVTGNCQDLTPRCHESDTLF